MEIITSGGARCLVAKVPRCGVRPYDKGPRVARGSFGALRIPIARSTHVYMHMRINLLMVIETHRASCTHNVAPWSPVSPIQEGVHWYKFELCLLFVSLTSCWRVRAAGKLTHPL